MFRAREEIADVILFIYFTQSRLESNVGLENTRDICYKLIHNYFKKGKGKGKGK